ncbi:MAG: circadian clock KaiB family protein [Gallionellaceae bacterium]|nr:circadian clock KaiB family protein [Gallionellaceae bacterium]
MSRRTKYKFRLYVAGDAPNSAQAQANLIALCQTHLPDRYEIEVVDVLKVPMLALQDNVLMTPTLLKLSPAPVRRIVGALSQMQTVLDTLGLEVIVK